MARASKLEKPKWQLYQLYNNVEHDLFEELVAEYTDIAGFEISYRSRNETLADFDTLYGEPTYQNTTFKPAVGTKMIYEPTEEPTLTTGFGINSEEVIQYGFIPKFIFNRDVQLGNTSPSAHPKPGDVISTTWNARGYEVVDVHEEENIFAATKLIWNFVLRPYRFSEQNEAVKGRIPELRDPTEDKLKETGSNTTTLTTPLSAFGDNDYLEAESDEIYDYGENSVDTSIYGY
jgi:hypothetical protein